MSGLPNSSQLPLLAGQRRSLTQIEPDAFYCGRFEHHLSSPTWWIDWQVDDASARNWRRPLLFSVALLGTSIALVLNLR